MPFLQSVSSTLMPIRHGLPTLYQPTTTGTYIVSFHAYLASLLISHSLRCIQVIAGVLGRAGEAGQKQRLALAEKGRITYTPAQNLVIPEGFHNKNAAAKQSSDAELDEETALNLQENKGLGDAEEFEEKLDAARNHELSDRAIRGMKKID